MDITNIKQGSTREDRLSKYDGVDKVISSEEFQELLESEKLKPVHVIKTKLPTFDKLTEGFESGEVVVVTGYTKHGKCHGKGTEIIMYDGSLKKVEDIKQGDVIMGDDSTLRKVVSLASGKDEMYKVIPKKGESFTANSSHVLSLKFTGIPKAFRTRWKKGQVVDISISDYLKKSAHFKYLTKLYRRPIFFQKESFEKLPLPPYFLGLWLGDGTSTKPEICSSDIQIESYLKSLCKTLKLKLKIHKQKNNKSNLYYLSTGKRKSGGYNINPITKALKDLEIWNNKRIPEIYKIARKEDRLLLLAGLIDSDGYKNPPNNLEICLKNKNLINDFLFLSRSLGFAAYLIKSRIINNKEYFRASLSGPLKKIPIKLKRKQCTNLRRKNPLVTAFKLESIGIQPYYGFELSGNGRYLLKDFTVTHNTSFCQSLTVNFASLEVPVKSLWFSWEVTPRQFFGKFSDVPSFYLPKELKGNAMTWVEDRIIEAKVKYGIKVVFLDHLHFLVDLATSNHPSITIGAVMRQLKTIALEQNILIFLIAHTKQPKGDQSPGLSDLRDSSFIAQESDIALTIQRVKEKKTGVYGREAWLTILTHRRMGVMGRKIKLTYQNKQYYEVDEREFEGLS